MKWPVARDLRLHSTLKIGLAGLFMNYKTKYSLAQDKGFWNIKAQS